MNAISQTIPAPGIYFGMPEKDYFAVKCFSASGGKHLLVSPLDYWTNCLDPTADDEESEAKADGKAYHKMLLEGAAAFDSTYVVGIDKEDYPEAIMTGGDLKVWLKERQQPASGTNAQLYKQAIKVDPDLQFWPAIKEAWEAEHAGAESVPRKTWLNLQRARRVLSKLPSAQRTFSGGYPEVSLFWVHEGVQMRARLDYLKAETIVDLKTFTNKNQKEFKQAAIDDIANRRYDLQPSVYLSGLAAIKALYAKEGAAIVHGEVDKEWLHQVLTTPRHRFHFAYMQSGRVPNFIVREWAEFDRLGGMGATANQYFSNGQAQLKRAVEIYQQYMEHFGPDEPWITDYPVTPITDDECPLYMLTRGTP